MPMAMSFEIFDCEQMVASSLNDAVEWEIKINILG